jgi:Tfp pilus assembly protein PilO
MRTLKSTIESSRRLSVVLLLSALSGMLAFYFLGFRPAQRELASLNAETQLRQRELSQARTKAGDLPKIAGEVERLRARLARSKRLLEPLDLPMAHREIMQIGQRSGLEKFRYEPDQEKSAELYRELPIQISFAGDFAGAYSFLRECEAMPRLSRVRRLVLKGSDLSRGRVEAEMSLMVYLSEGP